MLSTLVFIGRVRHNLSIESLIENKIAFLYTLLNNHLDINEKRFKFCEV